MTIPPLLTIRGVRKALGATQALAGIDLDIASGEILALMGANGAGKSTLAVCRIGVPDNAVPG
jgi:branched-chain amino acid transport system ATP-binding protein